MEATICRVVIHGGSAINLFEIAGVQTNQLQDLTLIRKFGINDLQTYPVLSFLAGAGAAPWAAGAASVPGSFFISAYDAQLMSACTVWWVPENDHQTPAPDTSKVASGQQAALDRKVCRLHLSNGRADPHTVLLACLMDASLE